MISLVRLLVLTSFYLVATSYKIYQQRIPNGDAVPHPCKPNNIWEGVGHFIDQGTGYRNPFGLDFEKEGHVWTEALCRKDSDGDGMTNGQELGDPNCFWKENAFPSRMTNITHPGVCDPWDSPTCESKNVTSPKYKTQMDWLMDVCKSGDFVCKGLNETDVKSLNLTIKNDTRVPAKETTYICQIFDLEQMVAKDDYHTIAVEPVLDNKYVIHHIVLFGCTDDELPTSEPYECGMAASRKCTRVVSIWTVGLTGECFHSSTGISIGNKGHKRIAVQLHWNNPDVRSDWQDSSGMRIYFTANKRQYEAGFMITGHERFILPPLQPAVSIKSTCPSSCTKKLWNKPIWVTVAWNHMHYAGAQMSVKVIRNDTTSFYLSDDAAYSYDSPEIYSYKDNPVQLLPGDELVTTCTFNTARRTKSTFWGEATLDEMCYGFLIFYPKENASQLACFTAGPDVNHCDNATFHGCSNLLNYSSSDYLNSTQMYRDLVTSCKRYGPCLQECLDTILRHKKENPCLNGDIFDYIKFQLWPSTSVGQVLLSLFASCDVEVYRVTINANKATTSIPTQTRDNNGNNSGSFVINSFFSLFIALMSVLLSSN
ncbi:hypothetical protein Btru_069960 [Bulinus truncatus]|nr:hypothetical protein Btru_069960 [Bulinus truncatus]